MGINMPDLFGLRSRRKLRDERLKKVQTIIDELDGLSLKQREIVTVRWLEEAQRYESAWRTQRVVYYWLRIPILIGAATVPVLAGLAVPKVATALVGLGVAILTGLDTLFRLGVRWQQERRAADAISFEGWQFLELSGADYAGKSRLEAYELFLTRLEALNEQLSGRYLDMFTDESQGPRRHLTV